MYADITASAAHHKYHGIDDARTTGFAVATAMFMRYSAPYDITSAIPVLVPEVLGDDYRSPRSPLQQGPRRRSCVLSRRPAASLGRRRRRVAHLRAATRRSGGSSVQRRVRAAPRRARADRRVDVPDVRRSARDDEVARVEAREVHGGRRGALGDQDDDPIAQRRRARSVPADPSDGHRSERMNPPQSDPTTVLIRSADPARAI